MYSWLFIDPSEHHHTTQTSKFNCFFNTVNTAIRLKGGDLRILLELFLFDFVAILKMNFLKPTLFSFGYDYHALACMVASQLNHQIILLLKHPLTHYWTSPLNLPYLHSAKQHMGKGWRISTELLVSVPQTHPSQILVFSFQAA